MFISISKLGGRYVFAVGDDPRDDRGAWLVSHEDSALLGDIPPTFASFGEAHAFAQRLADERPSAVMAKKASFYSLANEAEVDSGIPAEAQVVAHYNEQVELIGQRVTGLGGVAPADQNDVVEAIGKEIEGVRTEINNLLPVIEHEANKQKFVALNARLDEFAATLARRPNIKKASLDRIASLRRSTVRSFSEAAMSALVPVHEDIHVRVASYDKATHTSTSILSTASKDVVALSFDDCLLLTDVSPLGDTPPRSSRDFERKYWEPIVQAVGHFRHAGTGMIAVPGLNQMKRRQFAAFSVSDGSGGFVDINDTTVAGTETWLIKKASVVTQPAESPIAVDDEVECVNRSLPSYFGRTGVVTAVEEKPNRMLFRVDFRRGLGFLWMDGRSLRKVNLGA